MTTRSPEPDVALVNRIRRDFHELPTLSLTLEQARRLWHADTPAVEAALDTFVDKGCLRLTPDHRYARRELEAASCRDREPSGRATDPAVGSSRTEAFQRSSRGEW